MKEIRSLTSLRGIAALAVVMQHFSTTAQRHSSVAIPSLVPHGYVAVDFFFVLSGFIMCYTYLRAFRAQGRQAYLPFLQKRAIRLLPLNVFVTLAIVAAGGLSTWLLDRNIFFSDIRFPQDLIANLLMLQGLGLGRTLNSPAWSVSAEFLAYIAFPALIAGAFSDRLRIAVVTGVLALVGLLVVAMDNPRLGLGSEDPVLGGLRCISEFTLGMLTYRCVQHPGCARWLARDRVAAAAFGLCLALLAFRVDLLVALTFPFIVAATAVNPGRVNALLSRPWVYQLGVISYSLYLIHNAFRPAALELLRALHPERLSGPWALAFALAASLSMVPLAWLSYRWVEHPSREALRRLVLRPASA